MGLSLLLPAIIGAIAGIFVALVTAGLTSRRETRIADRAAETAHSDRVRAATAAVIQAAVRVGEGKEDAHAELRQKHLELLLVTRSPEVEDTSRQLLRTSWNVKERLAGREGSRPPMQPDIAPSKEIRARTRTLIDAVRKETGIENNLRDEIPD